MRVHAQAAVLGASLEAGKDLNCRGHTCTISSQRPTPCTPFLVTVSFQICALCCHTWLILSTDHLNTVSGFLPSWLCMIWTFHVLKLYIAIQKCMLKQCVFASIIMLQYVARRNSVVCYCIQPQELYLQLPRAGQARRLRLGWACKLHQLHLLHACDLSRSRPRL